MTRLVYVDLETTGLDPTLHEVWEVAWAVDDEVVRSAVVPHLGASADPAALAMNGYWERAGAPFAGRFEGKLRADLDGATLVGANPAFDAAFLRARWGVAPWRYRLLDVEAYAMPILGYDEPKGLKTIRDDLVAAGYVIPAPDHTAAGDVETVRRCHQVLRGLAKTPVKWMQGVSA